MPKADVMIHLEVTNEEGFSGFASTIPGLLAEFGGRALVGRDAVVSTLENQVTNWNANPAWQLMATSNMSHQVSWNLLS